MQPSNETPEPPKPSDKSTAGRGLFTVGVVLTLAYLSAIAWYWRHGGSSLLSLSPNEFGDFLAGTFAPLAFLWLVLGFLQQGHELRNSADALWLQGRELQNSVEQQRELVNVTREQLRFEADMLTQQQEEIERNSQPIFRLRSGGHGGAGDGQRRYFFNLFNHGKTCTDLKLRVEPDGPIFTAASLVTAGHFDFKLDLPIGNIPPFDIMVTYLDERLLRRTTAFRVSLTDSKFMITEAGKGGRVAMVSA